MACRMQTAILRATRVLTEPACRIIAAMKPELVLATALMCIFSFAAPAQTEWMTLQIDAMRLNGDARLNGDTDLDGRHFGYASGRFRFGDKRVPHVAGQFNFSERQHLVFDYFAYDRERSYVTDQDFDYEDVTIPAGSEVDAGVKIALGSLLYDYTLEASKNQSLALQFGAAWGQIRGRVHAEVEPLSATLTEGRQGFAPVLGLRFSAHSSSRKWRFSAQGQYINADWLGLDTYTGADVIGHLWRQGARHVGIHAGYDWFRLNVGRDFGAIDSDLVLRFMGPSVGLSLSL